MDFYDFTTIFSLAGKKALGYEEFYRQIILESIQDGARRNERGGVPFCHLATAINQFNSELDWYRGKQPYYKVYPDYVELFMKTKLHVPTKFLRLPFSSILIRFPKENTYPNASGHPVRTILASEYNSELLIGDPVPGEKRRMQIWIDIGEKESDFGKFDLSKTLDGPVYSFCHLIMKDDENDTIEDAFYRLPPGYKFESGILITEKFMEYCLRIVSAVAFLATGADQLIQPDILTKDQSKYEEASPERKKQLVEKSLKRGKHGFTVGKESVIGKHWLSHSKNIGTGKALKYSHLRSGHFHVVRYGPGKRLSRVDFFQQIRVKPELPLKFTGRRTKAAIDES